MNNKQSRAMNIDTAQAQDNEIIESLDRAVAAYQREPEFLPGEGGAFLSALENARNLISSRARHRQVMKENPPPQETVEDFIAIPGPEEFPLVGPSERKIESGEADSE